MDNGITFEWVYGDTDDMEICWHAVDEDGTVYEGQGPQLDLPAGRTYRITARQVPAGTLSPLGAHQTAPWAFWPATWTRGE